MSETDSNKPIDLPAIYLEPRCSACIALIGERSEGRLWCEDPQEPCVDCGRCWVRYDLATPEKSDE